MLPIICSHRQASQLIARSQGQGVTVKAEIRLIHPEEICRVTYYHHRSLTPGPRTVVELMGWDCLPMVLESLQDVQELDLRNNGLEQLPAEIRLMKRLRLLDVSGNNLTDLPEELETLPMLQHLDLSRNLFTSVPEVVRRLAEFSNVQTIFLKRSPGLKALPSWLGPELKMLTYLDFSYSGLNELPDNLCQLQHLHHLNVSNNELSQLPPLLFKCKSLCVLKASGNRLTSLEPNGSCKGPTGETLRILDLSSNCLTTIPRALGDAVLLLDVNVDDNQIKYLPYKLLTGRAKVSARNNLMMSPASQALRRTPMTSPGRLFDLAALKVLAIKPDVQLKRACLPVTIIEDVSRVRTCDINSCQGKYFNSTLVRRLRMMTSGNPDTRVVAEQYVCSLGCEEERPAQPIHC